MDDRYSILAADDEQFNLDLIDAAFMDFDNVDITYVNDGQEVLDILEKEVFDVLLLDISMPVLDGIETLKQIRQRKELVNFPVIMVTANVEKEYDAISLNANDFISKPYDIDILTARTLNYAKLNKYYTMVENQKEILENEVQKRTKELNEALKLAKRTEYEISIRLGLASEFRDLETGGHIKRMSHYSALLAKLYGLSQEDCELILYAAPLHDIGKVGIPDKILLKPGRFDENEFEIMKQHVLLGAKMLEGADDFPVLKAGHTIALQHHERWDGNGYPNKLKGEDIHLYARIVAIADVFDALSSKRCYKEAMPLDTVISIIKENSATQFDPKLVELLLDNLEDFLVIKEKYKDDNSVHNIMDIINNTNI